MVMKKALALVMSIAFVLCFSLVSCQKQEAPPETGGQEEKAAPEAGGDVEKKAPDTPGY